MTIIYTERFKVLLQVAQGVVYPQIGNHVCIGNEYYLVTEVLFDYSQMHINIKLININK